MKSYRVVCSDSNPNWLSFRHELVTGTATSTLMRSNPYQKYDELLAEKSGPIPEPIKPNRYMFHGKENESNNMRKFRLITGLRARNVNYLLESTRVPKLGTTLDGVLHVPKSIPSARYELVSDKSNLVRALDDLSTVAAFTSPFGLIEMKQTSLYSKKKWDNGVPEYYYWQVQAQMLVTGYPWCLVVCAVGASDFVTYLVEANEEDARKIEKEVGRFWKKVGEHVGKK